MEKTITERLLRLEKKVAALEGKFQEQPTTIKLDSKQIANTVSKIAAIHDNDEEVLK